LRSVSSILNTIGLNAKDDPEGYDKFVGAFTTVLTALQDQKGAALTTQEVRDVAQDLIKENIYSSGTPWITLFGDWGPIGSETRKVYEEENPLDFFPGQSFNAIEEELTPSMFIPDDIRKAITDAYVTATGQQPTEAIIQSYYVKGMAKQRGVK
jgi:hypothetical protein